MATANMIDHTPAGSRLNTAKNADQPLEHIRAAHLNLPGEVWDALLQSNNGDPALLEKSLGPTCEIFDSERGRFVLKVSSFLESSRETRRSLAALFIFVERAKDFDYDFLMISF